MRNSDIRGSRRWNAAVVLVYSFIIPLMLGTRAYAGDTVNAMIVATPAAIAGLGGPDLAYQKLVTDVGNINQSFVLSGIDGFMNVVYTRPFEVVEMGCMYDMLNEVLTVRGVELAKLHEDRTTFGADIVIIIVNEPSQCGIAGAYGYAGEAFALVHYECMGANYSMARQLGYLLGCGNNESQSGRYNITSEIAFAYFYDNEEDIPEKSFSTIMGYTDERISSTESDFDMIPYWSSADTSNVRYRNLPVGDEHHDNAGQIKTGLKWVAGYREVFGMLRERGLTLKEYNSMRLEAKRSLDLEEVETEANTASRIGAKRIRLRNGVRFQRGSSVRLSETSK